MPFVVCCFLQQPHSEWRAVCSWTSATKEMTPWWIRQGCIISLSLSTLVRSGLDVADSEVSGDAIVLDVSGSAAARKAGVRAHDLMLISC